MLDAFRKHPGKATAVHADELQALIAASREERAALSMMLAQIQVHAAKLAAAGKACQDVEARVPRIEARIAAAAHRLESLDRGVEGAETRLDALDRGAGNIGSRIEQAERLASDVGRSAAAGDRLLEELARVEARQREIVSHGEAVEAHARRIEEVSRELQSRQAGQAAADERLVADVHGQTAAIATMLEDVRAKMETIGEHRATIDGVLASFSELGGLVQEAQSTLGALQAWHLPAERRTRGVPGRRA